MRAVVMGGSAGIGLAVAEALTDSGMKVTVTGRDQAKLAALDGRVAAAERLDGTDREAVTAFFDSRGPFEHLVLAFSPGPVGLGPIRERQVFGRTVLLFDGVDRARLTPLGEVRTPSIADLFVALIGGQAKGAAA